MRAGHSFEVDLQNRTDAHWQFSPGAITEGTGAEQESSLDLLESPNAHGMNSKQYGTSLVVGQA